MLSSCKISGQHKKKLSKNLERFCPKKEDSGLNKDRFASQPLKKLRNKEIIPLIIFPFSFLLQK